MFAATRYVAVAPWNEDVKAKPIFAASDSSGQAAKSLVETAFCQFGSSDKADVQVFPEVQTQEAILEVVSEAAKMAPAGSLAVERKGAFVAYTLADRALGKLMAEECHRQGVPCINMLEPVLSAMERCLGMQRSLSIAAEPESAGSSDGRTVFVVSDGSGSNACSAARGALKQLPGNNVTDITVCGRVSTLEEVTQIAETAKVVGSMVIYTFASPGISRFMRMQCERQKVPYADLFQPVLLAFEKYLDYPPVGVPGGHDIDDSSESPFEKWESRRVQNF